MQRLTDLVANALATLANAVVSWARQDWGLPITITGAATIPITGSAQLTITLPTDSHIRSITHTVLLDATGAAVPDAFLDRIDVAGFQIYDAQTAVVPLPAPVTGAGAPGAFSTPLRTLGYPKGFRLRQGDTIQFTFTSNNAAVTRGSVQVDAYRIDQLRPQFG